MSGRACDYCGKAAAFSQSSAHLYRGKDYGPVWECRPCEAWVGCHPGTKKPLGRLANKALRMAKMRAHSAFDPLWKSRLMSRTTAYRKLAEAAKMSPKDCHIGMFDVATCERVETWATRMMLKLRRQQVSA